MFEKRKQEFPRTLEDHLAATSKLAAIITTDIVDDFDPVDRVPIHGDPLHVLIYESGLVRMKFPSGRVIRSQHPGDLETVIKETQEGLLHLAGVAVARSGSCRFPRIEVHRVPASGPTIDWLHSIGMAARFQKPDGSLTEWE
jgi:hypothetical protein